MKNFKKSLLILPIITLLTSSIVVGQVEYTLTSAQDVVSGSDTYFEADIMVSVSDAADSFIMGSGQLYFNYNTNAFGENIRAASSVEIIREGYLLGLKDSELDAINVYSTPVINDNTSTRFSVAWIQDRAAGCISTNVSDTPQVLFKIRIKYESPDESSDVCFETDNLFTAQTFAACGPFDSCAGFPPADCTNEPGIQIVDDNFVCEITLPTCVVMGIPPTDAINDGACVTALSDWQHQTNDVGQVLFSVNPMGNDVGDIAANLYVEDEPISYETSTFLLQRHYKIVVDNEPQSGVMLRLYFSEQEFISLMGVGNTDSITELIVAKYSGSGEDDIYNPDEGGTLEILTPNSTGMDFNAHYVEIMTNSFSEFWIGVVLLPVELVDFQAINKQREVELKWQTATELNSDYFEVQRSRDGVQFAPMDKIQAAGTTSIPQNYIYIDTQPPGGYVYYRLEQFDIDNTSTYSNVEVVYRKSSGANFSIYPNPAKDEFFINYKGIVSGDLQCKIYNILGKEVYNMTWTIPSNERIEVPISQLSEGVYLIQLINGELGETIEFIKH